MGENKTFASLDPVLLARKGTAKPAMRAQLGSSDRGNHVMDALDTLAASQDELGWNDMGESTAPNDNVVALEGARDLQDSLSTAIETTPRRPDKKLPDEGQSQTTNAPETGSDKRKRAAFTLRLDEERHLKLRLASTIRNCSGQALVTEALDRLLSEESELDSLAKKILRKTNKA